MATYKVKTENELAGVGMGGTVTDSQLNGWDIAHLVKTGVLELVENAPTKEKKEG